MPMRAAACRRPFDAGGTGRIRRSLASARDFFQRARRGSPGVSSPERDLATSSGYGRATLRGRELDRWAGLACSTDMSDRGGTPAGDRFTRSRIRDSTKLNVGVCLGSARQRPMPPGSLRSAQGRAHGCVPCSAGGAGQTHETCISHDAGRAATCGDGRAAGDGQVRRDARRDPHFRSRGHGSRARLRDRMCPATVAQWTAVGVEIVTPPRCRRWRRRRVAEPPRACGWSRCGYAGTDRGGAPGAFTCALSARCRSLVESGEVRVCAAMEMRASTIRRGSSVFARQQTAF